jgi:Uma2 family endonuclease
MRRDAMSAIAEPMAKSGIKPERMPVGEQRFLLHGVDWKTYVAIADAFGDRAGLHITYDRGSLEFMTLSTEHEGYKALLRRLLETLALEMKLRIKNLGSMTCRKEDLERGLEPDECFYIANVARMRGVKRFNAAIHPPPDLAIEVDVSRSSLNRLGIYAALRVSEVWRFDGDTIQIHRLADSGDYEVTPTSLTFPTVSLAELVRFVRIGEAEDDTTMVIAFQDWLRDELKHSRE